MCQNWIAIYTVSKEKKLEESPGRIRYLEWEELYRLKQVSSPYLWSVIMTAVHTGMRKGEIMGLKWIDINFNNCIIYLHGSATKTRKSREIPIASVLFSKLQELKKNSISQYVFCDNNGKPLKEIRNAFERALKKADIKDFRFHDLRHTFASQLIMAGVDIRTGSDLLGHSTIQMTMKYSHLLPNHKKAAVETLASEMVNKWSILGNK